MVRGRRLLSLLAFQVASEYWRLDRKPPVTAGLLAVNTLLYLRAPDYLDRILPHIDQVWFNPYLILKHKDLRRFLLSAFYHIDESHLVYNMVSLLWKGIRLESSMGSYEYARMVAILIGLSQGITLFLAKTLLHLFNYERPYYQEYSVGFSGVLFAMKVVINSQRQSEDSYTNVHGVLVVPSRYAAWAELFLIQMFVPNASFLGHLGGILAGIIYLKLKKAAALFSSGGRGTDSLMTRIFRILWRFNPFTRRHHRIFGRSVGGQNDGGEVGTWSCQACTFNNSFLFNVCEMCGTGRSIDDGEGAGLASLGSNINYSHNISQEELRRRRVQRLNSRR